MVGLSLLLWSLWLRGTRLDVCVWSRHNGRCTQSLRLIGGRSPGSQTPGDPATPRSLKTQLAESADS